MSNHHTYKMLELVGSSPVSPQDAIENAIAECAKSVDHLDWFEVVQMRGHINDGKVAHYQVILKVGFKLKDS
ncbi:MAG: dodecin domain-containing protein [Hahellaceae bacterium]|nr:dodecin domain-containing protein [Hahellaceae bacterium]